MTLAASTLQTLAGIVGREYVCLASAPRGPEPSEATSPWGELPDAVVLPATTDEVAQVVRCAAASRVRVRTEESNVMCEGDQGHIILALSRLDDIIEIDSDRLYARIQPAVSETRLQEAATAAGMTVPRVPHSGLRFTRANLLAIEVVTARGRIIRANRRALIEQADSVDLLAKLAGTMCVVTEVTLPMIPRLDADRSGCS